MTRLAALAIALLAPAALLVRAEERQEFHQTYPLAATGHLSIHNVNGVVRVTAWDRNEVKVDAVKRARTRQDLEEARIVVDARADVVDIRTKYPEFGNRDGATVDYTVMAPRQAVLQEISSVNGKVEIEGAAGTVKASAVNGEVQTRGLAGDADLSTVNGRVDAEFEKLAARRIKMHSVNGPLTLTLPAGAGVRIAAHTVNGGLSSDFDLPVRKIGFGPGRDVETTIGDGSTDIRIDTVNGAINLKRR
jgi:hypothetical protein